MPAGSDACPYGIWPPLPPPPHATNGRLDRRDGRCQDDRDREQVTEANKELSRNFSFLLSRLWRTRCRQINVL